MPITSATRVIVGWLFSNQQEQTLVGFSTLCGVGETVIVKEFDINPKKTRTWLGIVTDFSGCVINPNSIQMTLSISSTFLDHLCSIKSIFDRNFPCR